MKVVKMKVVKFQLNINELNIFFFSLSKDSKAVLLQFTWDSKKDTGCTVCLTAAAAWFPFSNFTEPPPKQQQTGPGSSPHIVAPIIHLCWLQAGVVCTEHMRGGGGH